MKKALYVFSNGSLRRKQNTLYLEREGQKPRYIPVETTSEIYLFGEVTVNKRVMEYLSQKEIILHFFNHRGYYIGSFYPREHYNSGMVILKQAEHYIDNEKRLTLARLFVKGAVRNMLKVLSYYHNRGVDLADIISHLTARLDEVDDIEDINELMALEGNLREVYYNGFDRIIGDPDFGFERRTRRPPRNRLNALVSFGNSVCYVTVLSEIYKTHLDPRIGYLHATNFRRFTLNLDVAEIFKPILVDRTIFSLLNRKIIKKSHFRDDLGGIYLTDNGRKLFIEEWEKKLQSTIRHRGLRRNVSYRRLIRLELYKIQRHLIEGVEYRPFVARW